MLEAKLETLNKYGCYPDGASSYQGVDDRKIKELAKDGWRLATTVEPRSTPEIIVGVFYRKVPEIAAPAPKNLGRPKKSDA